LEIDDSSEKQAVDFVELKSSDDTEGSDEIMAVELREYL